MEQCPICLNKCKSNMWTGDRIYLYNIDCPQCGNYTTNTKIEMLIGRRNLTERQKANISAWLAENEGYEITSENLDNFLIKLKPPSFIDRADNLLRHIAFKSDFAGASIQFDKSFISRAWCVNEKELQAITDYLITTKRMAVSIEPEIRLNKYKVLPDGWIRLEELSKSNPKSSQGFVAMSFSNNEEMHLVGKAITAAIGDAGYKPLMVNKIEHVNKICDEIIYQIRRSKFVVVDFTEQKPNVYFEAGFAKGLGLEVFWLCKKEDIDKLHFDIRQYNCIEWISEKNEIYCPDDKKLLQERLTQRIVSMLGKGPEKS
ncbi:MAG: hypothetical protein E3K37_02910 [Candidatus Kuenenia sp.]|nr:hypothetical protein [Candidatus Kuenenia hertensis]